MNLQSLKQHYTWRHKELKFPIAKYEGPGLLELSTELSGAEAQPAVFPQPNGTQPRHHHYHHHHTRKQPSSSSYL